MAETSTQLPERRDSNLDLDVGKLDPSGWATTEVHNRSTEEFFHDNNIPFLALPYFGDSLCGVRSCPHFVITGTNGWSKD
ncbi:MAG: hypothetical protein ABI164_01675 [Acidobacteriaceae bacterium]